jgi:hypothetical protein
MHKRTIAVLALMFAVLGGCASSGDMIGTGAIDTYDVSGPFPRGILMQGDAREDFGPPIFAFAVWCG